MKTYSQRVIVIKCAGRNDPQSVRKQFLFAENKKWRPNKGIKLQERNLTKKIRRPRDNRIMPK